MDTRKEILIFCSENNLKEFKEEARSDQGLRENLTILMLEYLQDNFTYCSAISRLMLTVRGGVIRAILGSSRNGSEFFYSLADEVDGAINGEIDIIKQGREKIKECLGPEGKDIVFNQELPENDIFKGLADYYDDIIKLSSPGSA